MKKRFTELNGAPSAHPVGDFTFRTSKSDIREIQMTTKGMDSPLR